MTIASQKLDPTKIKISHLTSKECIAGFSCGVREIDGWAKSKAAKFHEKGRARVFIARQEGSKTPLGFYSLSFSLEKNSKLINQDDRDAWQEGAPLIYVDYIGVAKSRQGAGIGTLMLIDALRRSSAVFDNVAVYGVALRSLNDRTTKLYQVLGFGIAQDEDVNPLMILPIWTIIDLFRGR